MGTSDVSERLVRAVELLALEPDDRILETGCGHGVAVSTELRSHALRPGRNRARVLPGR